MGPCSRTFVSLLLPALLASCAGGPRTAVPAQGPAAEPDRSPTGVRPASSPPHTEADVRFMQGMISHHRQALAMTTLVPERSTSESIHLLAERIEVSQADEIAFMTRWLESVGEQVPSPGMHDHSAGHELMPGMLTQAELDRLAAASGPAFDRLFLESMIRHHEGALVMVGQLFASPGAGQAVDVFRFASEVDSDQRIEIQRMQSMLRSQDRG